MVGKNAGMVGASSDALPQTRYVASGAGHVAYQVLGSGAVDLLVIQEWMSHQEARWWVPEQSSFYRQLARFARVITFDKRGCGMSDAVVSGERHTFEEWIDDVIAVLDAADCSRAALLGLGTGGPMAILTAATHPERVRSLVLFDAMARVKRATDYPAGVPEPLARDILARASSLPGAGGPPRRGTGYGSAYDRAMFGAELADNERFLDAITRWRRSAASPRTFEAMTEIVLDVDVRSALSSIDTPTLVLHRRGDAWTPVANGRYLADHIRGAKYVELEGDAHAPYVGNVEELVGEVEEFLTGTREPARDDRFLATVMFTDIVGSTERAAALGDRRWSELLASHNDVVRRELARHRGVEVATTGDGFVARFDGPARAIACATAACSAVAALGLEIRAGLHTGECQHSEGTLTGITVHIAARIAALAGPRTVLVSQTVKDLVVGSGLSFTSRGRHVLKGVPEEWAVYEVVGS